MHVLKRSVVFFLRHNYAIVGVVLKIVEIDYQMKYLTEECRAPLSWKHKTSISINNPTTSDRIMSYNHEKLATSSTTFHQQRTLLFKRNGSL